ncbi:hypothetical protein AB0E25_32460 [Streptomyces bobili]|uniref:hypothetical protein n=1 Tax=Streptomyces bobili TaxID=67280 RepID=UPI00340536B0
MTTGSILPGRQGRRDPVDGFVPDGARVLMCDSGIPGEEAEPRRTGRTPARTEEALGGRPGRPAVPDLPVLHDRRRPAPAARAHRGVR